jgi:hypothetical protein
VQQDAVGKAGLGQVAADAGFLLGVLLHGVQRAARGQALGQAQGRVAGEGAQLQNAPGLHHVAEHAQQAALGVAREHARGQHLHVGFAVEAAQQVGFGAGVGLGVGVEFVVGRKHGR